MNCSPPGGSAHGIFWPRILGWLPLPPPGDLPDPGIEPTAFTSPALAAGLLTILALPGKALLVSEWPFKR